MPGLSIPSFRALNYLRRHPGASLSEVAKHLGLTLPSASKLVQKLVTQKVVARRVAEDRRRICLSLTQRGRTAFALARLETHQQLAEGLRSLSKEELATVSAALRVLGGAFSQGGADVSVP
ncbi:MAG: MarR family transcriptional regulator [Chloroflexi bacterium]|nr:MarR family transcriptional regulator [Chloroflexota bacterium]